MVRLLWSGHHSPHLVTLHVFVGIRQVWVTVPGWALFRSSMEVSFFAVGMACRLHVLLVFHLQWHFICYCQSRVLCSSLREFVIPYWGLREGV